MAVLRRVIRRFSPLLRAFQVFVLPAALGLWPGVTADAAPGANPPALELMTELGCAACHGDLPAPTTLRDRTPDLASAGLRYRPAYLFDFLQDPARVHPHLGRARMPDFHLSPSEALALALFLQDQRQTRGTWPPMPPGLEAPAVGATVEIAEAMPWLRDAGRCLNCHRVNGEGGSVGIELTTVGYRLQPDWVRRYLVAPAMFGVDPGIMPPPFFQPNTASTAFQPLTNDAVRAINTITSFLSAQGGERRAALEAGWLEARTRHPDVTAAQGEQLFVAFNCAACHRHHRLSPRTTAAAPPLMSAGTRLQSGWLEAFLRHPQPVRPFGFQPGDGARMPDFRLEPVEVSLLANYLSHATTTALPAFEAPPPSVFSRRKAVNLMRDKLDCLGCHAWRGEGGRMAPDLALAAQRLRPEYVRQMLRDPQSVAPHSIMPKPMLPESTADLITRFLMDGEPIETTTSSLSPLDHPLLLGGPDTRPDSAPHLHLTHCAGCHGTAGHGDGFNARYLPVQPTAHADAAMMGTRPDDTLFDGIHGGGAILNKSPRMPAWGGTLAPEDIRALVAHLRTLCQCRQPAWAEDAP